MKFKELHSQLINGEMSLSSLENYKEEFSTFAAKAESSKVNLEELKAFIKLCLNYYTYSENGDVLIPDYTYDMCVNKYYEISKENRQTDKMFLADPILTSKQWNFVDHKVMGLVGTIADKFYSYDEVKSRFAYYKVSRWRIAPKYDGISVAIEYRDNKIIYAATRYDGYQGQDIRQLVVKAKFPKWWKDAPDGFYKCEILMARNDYETIINHKYYANQRSAVSGIVNTPSNIEFGKYLTIMPLVYYEPSNKDVRYIAMGLETVDVYSPRDLMQAIENKLSTIRSNDFPFRVDGVVVYPDINVAINEGNLMEYTFAYKVNTNQGITQIEYVYPSVGRLGSVTPMAHVKPVEVNETTVTEVSLGSYAKFLSMNLRENEDVIVYSAGDVIPQIKLPDIRTNWTNEPELKMSKRCPYCGEKFTKISAYEYKCTNPECVRVMSGTISNFLIKLGIVGFSDKTFELLCRSKAIRWIPDVFELSVDTICGIDGFDYTSAQNLYNEIKRIQNERIQLSEFFGALGIEGISTKKCRKILSAINFSDFMKRLSKDKNMANMKTYMSSVEGIGTKTAVIFVDFVRDNFNMISKLLQVMNIVGDTSYIGEVCFTGFRNSRWEDMFNSIGYRVGDSVNSNTTCLISANIKDRTSKMQSAITKRIPIFSYNNIDEVFDRLKNGQSLYE